MHDLYKTKTILVHQKNARNILCFIFGISSFHYFVIVIDILQSTKPIQK